METGEDGTNNSLYKPVTTATPTVILLELNKFQLAKRLKHVLQVGLRDAKVDVAHVQTVEGNRVGMIACGLGVADLTIFLGLGKLDDNGDT